MKATLSSLCWGLTVVLRVLLVSRYYFFSLRTWCRYQLRKLKYMQLSEDPMGLDAMMIGAAFRR